MKISFANRRYSENLDEINRISTFLIFLVKKQNKVSYYDFF